MVEKKKRMWYNFIKIMIRWRGNMKLQNKDSIMNLGDTSFRRKNLLDDYKVMLQGITE